jgi:hypothetical protein
VNGVAECRPPLRWRRLTSPQTIGNRLKRVTRGDLRVAPFVDIRADALHRRHASVGTRGFKPVEAEAIDRLERQLVLKTRLGAGIELARRRDSALPIQVRAVTLETQGACRAREPASLNVVGIGLSGGGSSGPAGFSLQSSAAGSTHRLRASAFQLSARKANPLILCELTVFWCHGSQSNRCL